MWSFFKKQTPAVTVVQSPQIVVVNTNWKPGMWVMVGDKVGITVKIDVTCEVHLVDTTTGLTTGVLQVSLGALRQAKFSEIPVCRVGHMLQSEAEALGYGS